MDASPTPTPKQARTVACPDCGEHFSPRGIAAHRRMRHNLRDVPNTNGHSNGRDHSAYEAAIVARLLAPSLDRLALVLERMDARLGALERANAPTIDPQEPPVSALEANLNAVIEEIDRVKVEASRMSSMWGGTPQTDEQRELEKTAYMHLGTLRRQQARLLFDLQDLKGQPARIDCIE